MTFTEYLRKEYRKDWDGLRDDMIFEGCDEDQIREREDDLQAEFEDYCEENDIEIIPE